MKTLLALTLLALGLSANAWSAARPTDAQVKALLNYGGREGARQVQLGDQLVDRKVQVLKCVYSFAVDGGAVGTLTLRDGLTGKAPCSLPNKAIITKAYYDVITQFVSTSNDGTIAIQANSAGDLLATVEPDATNSITTGLYAMIPVGTAATMVKTTAARDIKMVIATHAFTAGKANFFIEYIYNSE